MIRHKAFRDRRHAGQLLASRLRGVRVVDPVILALPRGGVPVAYEVAKVLDAPLELVFVRKVGVPDQPELAAAAVVDGGEAAIVVNESIVAEAGIGRRQLDELAKAQVAEIERRRKVYQAGRPRLPLDHRELFLIDDGIATGASIRAALLSLRQRHPKRLILAIPVASPASLDALRPMVDEIVCLECPDVFHAVGEHYEDFRQVTDAEVIDLLRRADRERFDD